MSASSDPGAPVVLLTTLPDPSTADRLAELLVSERLAACVTRIPGARSTYRWQGKLEEAEEVLLLIKTRAGLVDPLRHRLVELHPYEVPEVLVFPAAGGHKPYLTWILESTTSGEPR